MVSVSKKTAKSIEAKWDRKLEEMRIKADFRFNILLQNKKKKFEKDFEWEIEKNNRKKMAYIRKKEEEYRKKRLNELREFEGRPKYEYKTEGPKLNPLQFAMQIAQENSRLRDTNEDGKGRCISCNRLCEWEELAGGHRYSRRFTNMCLEKENINAQCHSCNRITGPLGNPALKLKTNNEYDVNIEKRFGEGSVDRLKRLVMDFTSGKSVRYDLSKKLPELIRYNEELWETKSEGFKSNHKQRKRREIWGEYVKRHPAFEE